MILTEYSPVTYVGDGSTTSFSFPYPCFARSDLIVSVDGVIKTLDTDYTVTLSTSKKTDIFKSATVVFAVAPSNNTIVYIEQDTPCISQPDEGIYLPSNEGQHDRILTAIANVKKRLEAINSSNVAGPPNSLSIGTVTEGATAAATITGSPPTQVLNLTLPQATDGADGADATIEVGTVTTLAAGEPATVTNSGTTTAAVFDFGIPAGQDGDDGTNGATWRSGATDPGAGLGSDGDFYLQTGSGATGVLGDVWEKVSGTWVKGINIRGASGAGTGDMLAETYDPQGIAGDAFDTDNHTDGATNKVFTATEKTKLSGIEASADVTDAGNVGSSIHGATAKATPVDADTVPLIDSAASNVLKKVTWANVKATLKTYFDTLYLTASSTATLTNKTFDAAGTGNSLSNVALSMFAANVADTDGTLAANSDSRVATQKAVKTYVDANAGGGGFWIGGAVVRTASGSESTGGSGNYNYNNDPTTAPTTSQAHRKDDATLAYTAQSASNKLRFNYAGSGSYTFSQTNGTQRVHVVAALYRDSEANAIAWAVAYSTTITGTTTGNQQGRCGFNLTFLVDPPDTSAHTYHIRFVNTTASSIGQGTMGAIVGRIFSVEELAI